MYHQGSHAFESGNENAPFDTVTSRLEAGGIAYVVVFVLVATFFVASVYFVDSAPSWSREGRPLWGFFFTYALTLIAGFMIQILAAVLLRWMTRVTGRHDAFHWIVFGAVLGLSLPWIFARVGYVVERFYFAPEWQTVKTVVMFPLMGAMMYEVQPAWVLLVVGGATGGTVRLMMRWTVPSFGLRICLLI